jgi:hypothetical protein
MAQPCGLKQDSGRNGIPLCKPEVTGSIPVRSIAQQSVRLAARPFSSLVGLRPLLARRAASAGVVAVLASWIEHVRRGRQVGREAELRHPGVLRDPDRVAIFAKASGLSYRLWVAGSSQPGHQLLDGIHGHILVGRANVSAVSGPRRGRLERPRLDPGRVASQRHGVRLAGRAPPRRAYTGLSGSLSGSTDRRRPSQPSAQSPEAARLHG